MTLLVVGCHIFNLYGGGIMRTHSKNKQLMSYALYNEQIPVYETDENGDILYDVIDGVNVPIETGETKLGYGDAKPFKANISM